MALLGSSCFFLGKSGPKMGFQNGYQKWPKKGSKNREAINLNNLIKTCFGYPLWTPIGAGLELFWNPFWTPKLVQNLLIFGSILDSFFLGFRSSLGASWEPSWASWGSLGRPLDPKTCENLKFFKGYEKAVFWSLKLLMALLGSSCCFLGKSGPKMGFQNGCQKWCWKTSK